MSRFAGVIALALVVALFAVPGSLQAQRRGGAAVGGGMHGGAMVAPRANNAFTGTHPSPVLPPVVSPVIRPPGRSFVPGVGVRPGAPIVRHRNVVVGPVFGYGYGLGYGLGSYYSPYYPAYADPFYSAPPYYSEPQYVPDAVPSTSAPSQTELELSYQVGQLSQQIEQLRQQQALAQPPRPVAPEPVPMQTVLVFRDGHRMEITNYAIIGQTLWVLDERNSTKIPISDLDVDATQKENRVRGLRFQVH
jgi:hypothetical protein